MLGFYNSGNVADKNAKSMEFEGILNVESFVTPSYTHLYNTLESVSLIKHCP
jgi:hypothetical protein